MNAPVVDFATAAYRGHRDELVALAYRMTGSRAEAEDLVHEGYLRLHREATPPDNPRAWLYRVVTRLCLDHLKSARSRREVYRGPWLPEPDVQPVERLADAALAIADEVTVALLLALERLSPAERAAFVLRTAFDLDYAELAATLDRSEAACRQLVSRARAHVQRDRPQATPPGPAEVERVFGAFWGAVMRGDVEGIKQVLADDVLLVSDGGGKALAAGKPLTGADRVARFFVTVTRKYPPTPTTRLVPARINGLPGVVVMDGDTCLQTIGFELDGDRITHLYAVRNPDKLTGVDGTVSSRG